MQQPTATSHRCILPSHPTAISCRRILLLYSAVTSYCYILPSHPTAISYRRILPLPSYRCQNQGKEEGQSRAGGGGEPENDVSRSGQKIHLPQTLSEEPTGDELSDWEQVSWLPAECIAHRQSRPPPASAMLPRPPSPFNTKKAEAHNSCLPPQNNI